MLNGMRTRWFALGDEICSSKAPSQSELEGGLRGGPGSDRVSLPLTCLEAHSLCRVKHMFDSLTVPFRRLKELFWRQDTGGATGVVWLHPGGSSGQWRTGAGGQQCGPCTWLCTTLCESTYFTRLPSSSSGQLRSYWGQNGKQENNG